MSKAVSIRDAAARDSKILSALAMRSKAYWGYSESFMNACIDELSVSTADIADNACHYVVAELDGEIIGFYSLEGLRQGEIELGALFVDPGHIGTGTGRTLIERAKTHARELGASILSIQGDPNATKFYRAAGAVETGRRESESIRGRFLPVFQIELAS